MINLGWKRLLIATSIAWSLLLAGIAINEYMSINIFDEEFDTPPPQHSFWKYIQPPSTLTPERYAEMEKIAYGDVESPASSPAPAKSTLTPERIAELDAITGLGPGPIDKTELKKFFAEAYPDAAKNGVKPKFLKLILTLIIPIIFMWAGVWSIAWIRNGFKKRAE